MSSTAQRLRALAALLAVTAALPATAHAANNALDPTFGTQGVAEQWYESASDADTDPASVAYPAGVWPAGGEGVVVSAQKGLRWFGATGVLEPRSTDALAYPVTRFPDGRWLAQLSEGLGVMGPHGRVVPGAEHLADSVRRLGTPWYSGRFAALADGTVLYVRHDIPASRVTATKLKLDGTVVRQSAFAWRSVDAFQRSIVSGRGAIFTTRSGVVKLRNDGSLDPRFGAGARTALPDQPIVQMVPWDRGGAALLTQNRRARRWELVFFSRTGRLARHVALAHDDFDATPELDTPFHYAIGVDAWGRVLLARGFADHSAITVSRYVAGRVDRTLGAGGRVRLRASHSVDAAGLTVLPDARIVVLGAVQRYGTISGPHATTLPGYEQHGAVLWRLNAR